MATKERVEVTLADIIRALRNGDAKLEIVYLIFGGAGTPYAVQAKTGSKKYGPMLLPRKGENLGDLMKMIGDLIEKPEPLGLES